MQLNFVTVLSATLLFAGMASAMPAAPGSLGEILSIRQECGTKNGPCDKNGCAGINDPISGLGVCTASFKGCPCASVCGPHTGSCSDNGCQGQIDSDGIGRCTAGSFNGCFCF